MSNSQGFWSYVHSDDQAEGGRIVRLAHDIVEQFQMLTGEKINLFLDKDAIEWGENWRETIDQNLASVAFFIPVMTPRYFMSPECRRELQFFARKASELGIKELLLPLYYIDVPSVEDKIATDELVVLIRTFQWEDWRELRFSDVASEGYRRGVSRLATKLVAANRQAEATASTSTLQVEEILDDNTDDSPGSIDLLATTEEALPKLNEILVTLKQEIEVIGQIMQEGTDNIQRGNSQGKGFSARLIVTRQVAQQISEPIEQIWSLSNEYASQLHDVDAGYRLIIERAPKEIQENLNSKVNFCAFFRQVREMNVVTRNALDATQRMIDAIEPLEKMSRDLRPGLRKLRQGLTIMVESRGVSDEWVRLIDSTGVICENTEE
jgi:hypothetical protein